LSKHTAQIDHQRSAYDAVQCYYQGMTTQWPQITT